MMRNKVKGFTLMELLCVISILGIISLLSYPNINKMMEAQSLNMSVKMLVNDLRFAKMYGISKNVTTVVIRFNGDTGSGIYTGYDIYYPHNLSGNSTLKHVDFPKEVIVDGWNSTFSNARSENRIEFRSDGSVDPACTIVVKDTKNNNKKYVTLTIGYTRIMEVVK